MTANEINERFIEITNALSLSAGNGYLNITERMMLHQERAALMRAKSNIDFTGVDDTEVKYQVSDKLDKKIKFINEKF